MVATLKLADDWPAGTVTFGTDAASAVSELASVTAAPPAGAAAPRVTVQVDAPPLPPPMMAGMHASAVTLCAWAAVVVAARAHAISGSAIAHPYSRHGVSKRLRNSRVFMAVSR